MVSSSAHSGRGGSLARARRSLAMALAAVMALAAGTLVVAGGMADPMSLAGSGTALFYVVPGLVVLAKREGHVMGWLLIIAGLAFAGAYTGGPIHAAGYAWWVNPTWYAWVFDNWMYVVAFAGIVSLITLFPEGLRGRSVRAKAAGKATLTATGVMVGLPMLTQEVGGDSVSDLRPNPSGLGVIPLETVEFVVVGMTVVLMAGALLQFWLRYRRATGAERAQYRWVGYAFALVIAGEIVGLIVSALIDADSVLPWIPVLIAFYLVPVAFSLAILRLGLYEIDRFVSRTVTYTVVAAVVAVVYATPVLALPRLLGESSDLVVAGSTLAAAAVFNPARRRIQRIVDHRFNRARFDAERQLEMFGSTLRSEVDIGSIELDLRDVVTATVAPERMALWIR